jgi:hypothetical protein
MTFDNIPDFGQPGETLPVSGPDLPPAAAPTYRTRPWDKPVVRVPAAKAPTPPAPAPVAPVPAPTPSDMPLSPANARMVFLRYAPEQGWFARFFGFPGNTGNELPVRGETFEQVVAYLRERNPKIMDSCWLMIAPRA